jgi:ankyrin repeat protein
MKTKVSAAEIHLVLHTKQIEVLKQLFAIGADPDAIYRGVTPLGHAVSAKDMKTVQILLQAGADPNLRSRGLNDRIEPPLYTACR